MQEEVTQILNILPLSLNITVVGATEILRPILIPGIGLLIFYEYLMVLFLVLELGSSMEGLHLEEEVQVVVVGCGEGGGATRQTGWSYDAMDWYCWCSGDEL